MTIEQFLAAVDSHRASHHILITLPVQAIFRLAYYHPRFHWLKAELLDQEYALSKRNPCFREFFPVSLCFSFLRSLRSPVIVVSFVIYSK
jgi:hypothetical protein